MNSKYHHCYLLIAMIFCLSGQVYGAAGYAKNITEDKKFTLTAIRFNQVGLIDSFEFYPIYEQFLGARVRVSTLKEICSEITQLYQEKGFSAAKCTIPAQNIKSGVVNIHIVEGLIGGVRLTGEVKENDRLLMSYINQIPLNQPLDETQLDHVVNLINTVAGVNVKAYTKSLPGTKKLDLVFDIKQTKYNGEVYVNNRGSKVIGQVQAGVSLASNSLLGMHESLRVHYQTVQDAEELKYIEFNSSWPVGDEGSKILVDTSYADSMPGNFLKSSNVDVNVTSGSIGWFRPLWLRRAETLAVTGQFDYFKSDTSFNDERAAFDELYKVKFSLDYLASNNFHYLKANITLTHGLSSLNKSVDNTVVANTLTSTGNEDFSAFKFNLYYKTILFRKYIMTYQTQGQYAFTDLPVSEYIVFGGDMMGSAYDPAELFGDHGLGGMTRLTYQLQDSFFLSTYTQLFTQYDLVKVWNERIGENYSAVSAALGIVFGSNSFYADVQVTKPLTRTVALEGNKNARLFASLRVFF